MTDPRSVAADMRRSGSSYLEVIEATGLPRTTLYRLFTCEGLTTPKDTRRRLSDDEAARAEELLDDGCSYREAARTLGVTAATLLRRFPGRGWPPGMGTRFANDLVRLSQDNLLPSRGLSRYDQEPNPDPFVGRIGRAELTKITDRNTCWEHGYSHETRGACHDATDT